jgi:hypothetical protein
MDAWRLDAQVAYLTSDHNHGSPLAQAYRIIEMRRFNEKQLRARLRELDRKVTIVKKRGVPMEPEEVARSVAGPGAESTTLILCRIAGTITAILCEPLKR